MIIEIDYSQYFRDVLTGKGCSLVLDSIERRRNFVSLFYEYRLPEERYLFSAKLFFEKYFIVDLAGEIGREIFANSFWEAETSNLLYNQIKSGDIFIDCGAAEGYYSFLAAHKLQGHGKVIAFEMNQDICQVFRINNSAFSNVELHQIAITGDGRDVSFNCYGRAHGAYSTIVDIPRFTNDDVKPTKVQVKSTTLQDILIREVPEGRSQNVTWIKIDLEGAEHEVLLASMDEIVKRNCILIIEVGFNENMTRNLFNLLSISGLKIFEIGLNGCSPAESAENFDFVKVRNILVKNT